MKKTIVSVMMSLAFMLSISVSAQDSTPKKDATKAKTECCKDKEKKCPNSTGENKDNKSCCSDKATAQQYTEIKTCSSENKKECPSKTKDTAQTKK